MLSPRHCWRYYAELRVRLLTGYKSTMYKSKLQELCQKKQLGQPDYATTKDGPDHHPSFQSTVSVGGFSFDGPSDCRSAKEAQSEAARLALNHFTGDPKPSPLPVSGSNATVRFQPNEPLHDGHMSLEPLQKNGSASTVQTGTQHELLDLSMYKSRLQELCQKKQWPLPKYNTTKDGLDHIPHFQTSVTVGGLSFDGPPNCCSAKEAQSKAAKIALNHFLGVTKRPHVADSGPPLSSSEAHSNSLVNVGMLKSREAESISLSVRWDSMGQSSKQFDLLENGIPCKNQLQSYAQRRNMNLPLYHHIREGSIHNFCYKGKVTVGTQTFESQQFFSSIKEAENEAAKVALISLFAEGEHVDEPVFHKNLLLELVQKEGLSMPVYATVSEGSSHMPTFVSTVEVEGENFKGVAGKTKKQAEQNAAKVAWTALKERKERKQARVLLSDSKACEDVDILYPSTSSKVVNMQKRQVSSIKNVKGGDNGQCDQTKKPIDVNTCANDQTSISQKLSQLTISSTEDVTTVKSIANTTSLNMELKSERTSREEKDGSAASGCEQLQPTIRAVATPLVLQFPDRAIADAGANSHLKSDESSSSCVRIQIYPRRSDLKLPDGSTVLPVSDGNWVAVKVKSGNA